MAPTWAGPGLFFTNQSSYNVSSKQSCKISKAYGARLIAFIIRQNFNTNEEHFNRKIKDFSPTWIQFSKLALHLKLNGAKTLDSLVLFFKCFKLEKRLLFFRKVLHLFCTPEQPPLTIVFEFVFHQSFLSRREFAANQFQLSIFFIWNKNYPWASWNKNKKRLLCFFAQTILSDRRQKLIFFKLPLWNSISKNAWIGFQSCRTFFYFEETRYSFWKKRGWKPCFFKGIVVSTRLRLTNILIINALFTSRIFLGLLTIGFLGINFRSLRRNVPPILCQVAWSGIKGSLNLRQYLITYCITDSPLDLGVDTAHHLI